MAVTCGTPTPATTRVVQIEPGPTPTLTPSAPASISASAASAVATLPAIELDVERGLDPPHHLERRRASGRARCRRRARRRPASTSASARSNASAPTPTAAPTRSRPCSSLVASGYCDPLLDVLDRDQALEPPVVVDDRQLLDLVPVQDLLGLVERGADRRRDEVLASSSARAIGWSCLRSKRRSRLVRMPTSLPSRR